MAGVGGDKMGIQIIADFDNVLGREQFDAKAFGLLNDALGKLRAGDAFGETGVIVQAFGNTRLSTQSAALDDQHIKAIACGINGSGESSGATAYDDQVVKLALSFGFQTEFGSQFGVRWLDKERIVLKNNGRNSQSPILYFLYKSLALHVLFNVDIFVVDTLFTEEFFAALAIAAPVSTIEFDVGVRHAVFLSLE